MTATDELRRLLDERGVEWDELVGHPVVVGTAWYDRDGCSCTALEHADDVPDGMLSVQANLTSAQAIAATLGDGTCHETMIDKFFRGCSECGYMWEYMYGIGSRTRPNYCPNCGAKVVE